MWPNSQEMGNIYTWLHLLKVSIMENQWKTFDFSQNFAEQLFYRTYVSNNF